MADESTYVGFERFQDPEESPFIPKKYRVTFVCDDCGYQWSKVYKAIPSKNPPCPDKLCKAARQEREDAKVARNRQSIIDHGPPGVIGQSVVTKAVDETAKIVMEDHKLTNLQDNVREGDMIAPKLPAPQQRMADGFFGGKAVAERNGLGARQMDLLGRRAIAGAFRNMAVNPSAAIPASSGAQALRHVRSERIK